MYSVVQITEDTPWVVVKDEEAEGLEHWQIAVENVSYKTACYIARDIASDTNDYWREFAPEHDEVPS